MSSIWYLPLGFRQTFVHVASTHSLLQIFIKFFRKLSVQIFYCTLYTNFSDKLYLQFFHYTFHMTFQDNISGNFLQGHRKKGKKSTTFQISFLDTFGYNFSEGRHEKMGKQRKINKRKGKRERWEHWTKDVLHERLANRGGPGPGARAVGLCAYFRRSVQVHTRS